MYVCSHVVCSHVRHLKVRFEKIEENKHGVFLNIRLHASDPDQATIVNKLLQMCCPNPIAGELGPDIVQWGLFYSIKFAAGSDVEGTRDKRKKEEKKKVCVYTTVHLEDLLLIC